MNGDEEANNDGRFTDYPKLRHFDPQLYDALHTIVNTGHRRLSAIEQAGILPAGTLFYSTPLTFRDLPSWNSTLRASRRGQWNEDALTAMAGADIVFMDPDNGYPGKSAKATSNSGPKYVFPEELIPYTERSQSLIVYHHQTREKGGLARQIADKFDLIRSLGVRQPWALIFRRMSVRVYFIIPAAPHDQMLRERACRLVAGRWGEKRSFELHECAAALATHG